MQENEIPMRYRFLFVGLVLVSTAACEAVPPPKTAAILPLRSLRLYETGVGYFERSGQMSTETRASLPVPAGHLDDALKSLVVLNGGAGGHVGGLSFASSVSKGMARSRAGLPVDVDQSITYRDLLVSMKGEGVEVTLASGVLIGRLIEVLEEPSGAESPPKTDEKEAKRPSAPKTLVVTLMTNKGEVVRLRAADVRRVRPTDPEFAARLDLDALSTRSAQLNRPLTLPGDAHGAITFGYIAETPIWRTTYRLLLSPGGTGGALQGWALLHNDTDESWANVKLSLVNGQPDSFVYPLAAPRYLRRSLVHPDDALSTIPQLQDSTADTLWGDNPEGLGLSGTGEGGGGYGYGHGSLGGSHIARSPSMRSASVSAEGTSTGSSALLSVGNLAEVATASGMENGALFTYTVEKPFSLDAHSSALVPFMQKSVDIEALVWLADVSATARNAVRFRNTTGQTLPAGTLAVFAAGGFAGETALDRLKPGERRFVQFGNELDAEVSEKKVTAVEVSKRLTFDKDRFEEHFLRTSKITYELENRAATARAFYVGLLMDRNAVITGTDGVDFDEANAHPVAVFRLKAKDKPSRTFDVTEGLSRVTAFEAITEKQLREIAAHASLPAAELAIATEAAARMKEAAAAEKSVEGVQKEIQAINTDVERFREHLKALGGDKGGTGVAAAPLVKRLLDAEDSLAAANKRLELLERDVTVRSDAVRAVLSKLAPG
jgi:hypothetical protein